MTKTDYVSRKEECRGFTCIEVGMDESIRRIEDYMKKNKEIRILATNKITDNIRTKRVITRKQKWEEKELQGYFKQ